MAESNYASLGESNGIQRERIRVRRAVPPNANGAFVLYWMQQSQRARDNHALEYAVLLANELQLPVAVAFGLTADYPEANARHYAFMLQGLEDVRSELSTRGIPFVLQLASPDAVALKLARRAAVVVTDVGYLRVQKEWRDRVAAEAKCPVIEVESDVVVPVETASNKEEYAARTLRPRIQRKLPEFLVGLQPAKLHHAKKALDLKLPGETGDWHSLLRKVKVYNSVGPIAQFHGGSSPAEKLLTRFVRHRLKNYAELRNVPGVAGQSDLSPYLHFGQVSPLRIALAVRDAKPESDDTAVLLEQLIVRRELSMNFVHFNPDYDKYSCIPEWARRTLADNAIKPRPYTFTLKQLEAAETDDVYWNAAQVEMVKTGKMHNTMRMYWGKKIIEWIQSPEEAFEIALYLNNKYELDGRDANSYAGVAWCFGKHDRPWPRRPNFGTVRSMNAKGLERKYDMTAYLQQWSSLS